MTTTDNLLATARQRLMPTYGPPSFIAARGEGVWLWDAEGRRYLDFTGGIGVNALGHAHPEVVAAISEQAARLCHTSNQFMHQGHVEIADRLATLSGLDRAFLCNSGTEAMEGALKLSRRLFHVRGRPRQHFVATHGSFHGRTMGALSITGQPQYHEGFGPLLADVTLVPFDDLEAMRTAVGPHTAAVIVEPIQGNSGVRVPSPGYLRGLRELCTRHGALLVCDEIQTGLGRTGRWFAYQHDDVQPDIITVAKAVGGGLPLGAVLSTAEVAEAFSIGSHGTTFGANPVACAAGLATLAVITRDHLVEAARAQGDVLRRRLTGLAPERPIIKEVRGRGLMIGVRLDGAAKDVRSACLQRGLLITTAGNDVIRLLPPLLVSTEAIDDAFDRLRDALSSAPRS